jgi:hypothetical protein
MKKVIFFVLIAIMAAGCATQNKSATSFTTNDRRPANGNYRNPNHRLGRTTNFQKQKYQGRLVRINKQEEDSRQ